VGAVAKPLDEDRLFQVRPEEFVRARNALAAELATAGRKDEAARVRALHKPSVSAWTVNRLWWRHRKEVERLLDVGARVRAAQAAQVAGRDADLRPLVAARRDATARLAREATTILRDAGHAATPETLRRVTTTLEALAARGAGADGPVAGRLTADVEPPGFEAFAGLTAIEAPASRRPQRREPRFDDGARRRGAERRARRAEARTRVRDAERALRDAQRARADARNAADEAAVRLRAATRANQTTEAAYARAATAVTEAERELERARADETQARSG
jgi:hypothetical protein